jgi:hypothetical protein
VSIGFLWRYQPGGNFNLDIGVLVQDESKGLAGGFDRSYGIGTISVNQKSEGPHVERIPISSHFLDCEDRIDGNFRLCLAEQSQDNSNREKADGQQNESKIPLASSRKEKQYDGNQDCGESGPEKHAIFYRREREWWEAACAIFGFLCAVAILVFAARHGILFLLFRADFDGFITSLAVWFCLFVIWDTLTFLALLYLPYPKTNWVACIYWWGFIPLWLWPLVLHLCYGNWAVLAGMFLFQFFWTIFCWSCGASISMVPHGLRW